MCPGGVSTTENRHLGFGNAVPDVRGLDFRERRARFAMCGASVGTAQPRPSKVVRALETAEGRFRTLLGGARSDYAPGPLPAEAGGEVVPSPFSSADERPVDRSSKYRSCCSRSRAKSCRIAPMLLS